jgi:hypothetical protein
MLIAIAQDTRVWVLAAGVGLTLAYNVLGVLIPYRFRTESFGIEVLAFPTAILNCILFAAALWYLLRSGCPVPALNGGFTERE